MHQPLVVPDQYITQLEKYLSIRLYDPVPKTLAEFAKTIHEISEGLNKRLSKFIQTPYLENETARRAYLLYYTTCNLLKIYYPLTELERSGFFERVESLNVLDLGAGTGTMLCGLSFWLDQFPKKTGVRFTGCDHASGTLAELELFYRQLGFNHSVAVCQANLENKSTFQEKFDLITGANFLNELSETGRNNVLEILKNDLHEDGFAIFIEPASVEASRTLLRFRDAALHQGWFVYAPCLTHKDCPALSRENDWCHHSVKWQRPKFIEIIDGMIGNVKTSLKFSYLILSRRNAHVTDFMLPKRNFETQFRVVSELFEEKGRSRAFLCNDLGRNNFLKNKRDRSASNRDFDELERYDLVQIEPFTVKKNQMQIEKDSKISKLNH